MNILSYIIAVAVLIVVLKIISLPFKIILRFMINSLVAGIILAILSYFGVIVILNGWIVILTGLFGVPGLIIGLVISMFI